MDLLKEKSMEDYVEICRMFEIKKRIILFDKNSLVLMIILQIYFEFSKECYKVKDFKEIIEKFLVCEGKVKLLRGKIKWENDFFVQFYKRIINNIIKYMDDLFQEK